MDYTGGKVELLTFNISFWELYSVKRNYHSSKEITTLGGDCVYFRQYYHSYKRVFIHFANRERYNKFNKNVGGKNYEMEKSN